VFGHYNEDVAVHSTRVEAEEEIRRCLEEDKRSEMARILVDTAINSYMQMFGTDRETAREEISHAAKWSSKFSEKQKCSEKTFDFYLAFLGTEPELVHDLIFCVR